MEKLSRRVAIARTRFRKKLYAMTDGIAAASPAAVAISASAMPGATVASVALPVWAMPEKAFMIPQTVPNRPMKGVALPVVARKGRYVSMSAISSLDAFLIA